MEPNNQAGSRLTPAIAVLTALCAAVLAVPFRIYELAKTVDPDTGFWRHPDPTRWVIYGLALVVIVLAFLYSRFSKDLPDPEFSREKSIPLGIGGVLLTLGFLGDTAFAVLQCVSLAGTYDPWNMTVGYFLISTGFLAQLFHTLFSLLSAVYFGFYAVDFFKGANVYAKLGVLSMNPVLWGIACLLSAFIKPIKYLNVSQLFLEVLFLIFASIAFFAFARLASQVESERSMWVLYFTGIPAMFLGYVCGLALFNGTPSLQAADLTAAIFFTILLIHYLPTNLLGKQRKEPVEEPKVTKGGRTPR